MSENGIMTIGNAVADTGELAMTAAAAEQQHEIQGALVMAQRFPRDEDEAFSALLKSCRRPAFADGVEYSFPRGDKDITGPTVKLAREAMRIWGNMRSGLEILWDDPGCGTPLAPGQRRIRGWAWDLETNARAHFEDMFSKLIQRKRGDRTEWVIPDERDLRELTFRRGAILVRNAILSLIPPDLIDDAMAIADETLAAEVKTDPDAARKRLLSGFGRLNVTGRMLSKHLGHPAAQCSPAELGDLRAVYASIRDGKTTWAEVTGARPKDAPPPPGGGLDGAEAAIKGAGGPATGGLMNDETRAEIEDLANSRGKLDEVAAEFGPPDRWEVIHEAPIRALCRLRGKEER